MNNEDKSCDNSVCNRTQGGKHKIFTNICDFTQVKLLTVVDAYFHVLLKKCIYLS